MASASPDPTSDENMSGRLAKNVTKDYLSCSICFERFREPKTLPCEHTFCMQCLAAHIERTMTDGHFTCPIDRQEINIHPQNETDPWVIAAELETDPILVGFINVVHDQGQNKGRRNSDALDFYCFGCKTLVNAEGAISSHKENNCECLKLKKAYAKMIPTISGYNKELEKLLLESRKLQTERKNNGGLNVSQKEVLDQIELFESKIENFFFSCKEQLGVLKGQVMEYKVADDDADQSVISPRIDDVHDAIADAYAQLNNAIEGDDLMPVVSSYSHMQPKIKSLRRRLNSVQTKSLRNCSFEFVPDIKIQEMIHTKLRIGTLHSIEHFNFRVDHTTDEEKVNLYDGCVTDKYILVTDGANNTAKRFLLDGSLVDSMHLSNPCRMGIINDTEVIVTRYFKKKITIISLGRKMHTKCHIRTKRPYVGITSLGNDKFATTFYDDDEPAGIDIINKDGKILHTLLGHQNTFGIEALFVVPMFIATTEKGHIVVCDYSQTHHVVCFDQKLGLLWRQTMDSVPCGVTCDIDSVYVTLPDEDKLVALYHEDGEKVRNIIKPCDGVKRPYAISVRCGELIVTEDESDKIHILRL